MKPQGITYCSDTYLSKENNCLKSSSLSQSGLVPLPGKFRADELREAEGTGTGDKVYFVKGQTQPLVGSIIGDTDGIQQCSL